MLLLLFVPGTPLLFMGQEVASDSPFLYFADHTGELGALVTKGRQEEFSHFEAFRNADPKDIPDPQAEECFLRSKVRFDVDGADAVREFHRLALKLRREDAVLRGPREVQAGAEGTVLWVLANSANGRRLLLLNIGGPVTVQQVGQQQISGAQVILATAPPLHDGVGISLPAESCAVFELPGR